MENLLGIQPYGFEPVYSEDEVVSDSDDSDLEAYYGEKIEVEDVDCVTQHMEFDITCLNPSLLATSS